MDTLANSEDPDEMQHNATFHQGLHCLQNTKWAFPYFILYQYVWENPSEYKGLTNAKCKIFWL